MFDARWYETVVFQVRGARVQGTGLCSVLLRVKLPLMAALHGSATDGRRFLANVTSRSNATELSGALGSRLFSDGFVLR
jgi:hypothetical protein